MDNNKKSSKAKTIIRLSIIIVVISAILIGLYFVFKHFGWTDITREELQDIVSSFGVWSPIIFIFISFLQVTFIPIPSTITILAGNYVFGVFLGGLYSFIGIMIGSIVAFALGRYLGKPFVNWVAGSKETVDNYLNRLKSKENIVLFFMFLFPAFPDDLLCSIAGILPVSWLAFIVMQIVTRVIAIGATLIFMSGEIIPYEGWGIAVIVILVIIALIIFIICFKNAEKINELIDKLANKIIKRNPDSKKDCIEISKDENEKNKK